MKRFWKWLDSILDPPHYGQFNYYVSQDVASQILAPGEDYFLGVIKRTKRRWWLFGPRDREEVVWVERSKFPMKNSQIHDLLGNIIEDLNSPETWLWVSLKRLPEREELSLPDDPYVRVMKKTLVEIYYYQYSNWLEEVERILVANKVFKWEVKSENDLMNGEQLQEVDSFVKQVCSLFDPKKNMEPYLRYISYEIL